MPENGITVDDRTISLSNLDKVLFPDDGVSKGDLIDYYRRIAGVMLPHMAGRPISMQRFPDGIAGDGFYHPERPTKSQLRPRMSKALQPRSTPRATTVVLE